MNAMTQRNTKLYSRHVKQKKLVAAAIAEFAETHQRRVLSTSDLPACIRDSLDTYLPKIEKSGYLLLSASTHPGVLKQGQFIFWPADEKTPANVQPPNARTYFSFAQKRPIGIDLFAGAGGLSMGFEQAGFDIAACVEIDPIHCATHEYNFPYAASLCGSVIDLTGESIRRRSGIGNRDIEVVFGGAPCQGFSMIGKRALDDPRNRLVSHYVRLVKELSPKYCVFENVKGLTVGKHVQFLNELISALEDAGYHVVLPYCVLNAADYGVPQNRFRLFLLAYRKGQTPPVYPLLCKNRVTVEEAIGDLPDADLFEALLHSDATQAVWKTKTAYAKKLRGQTNDPADFSYPRVFDRDDLTCSLRTVHTIESKTRFVEAESGTTEPISRFFKLSPGGQCNTIRAGTDSARGAFTSPRPIHPSCPRVITVREAARLHSYPDWFRFHATKWHGFRQIGNSVPPLLGRAVASEIMKALGIEPSRPQTAITPGDTALLTLNMRQAADHFGVPASVIGQRTRKKALRRYGTGS
jgi:DNA (cytosine-5)-methyltransferase 1